jgi:Peptidase family S64
MPYNPPDGLKLEGWSSKNVRKGQHAYKSGRTTGLTHGTFNAIDPAIQLDGKICSAWHIVGTVEHSFCQPGDSGSFIIDPEGNWCALLFAAPFSFSGDGFVLPVDDLIADIEQLTGGTVSLP